MSWFRFACMLLSLAHAVFMNCDCAPAEIMFEEPDEAVLSYEAGIFSRLTQVKAQYDPLNLFRDLHYVHPTTTYTVKDAISTAVSGVLPFGDMAPVPSMAAELPGPGPMAG